MTAQRLQELGLLFPDSPISDGAARAAKVCRLGANTGAAGKLKIITHNTGNSWRFENRMAHALAGDHTPLSAVDIFVRDLGLVPGLAGASKLPRPLSSTAHQMSMQVSAAGFAAEDNSAVIKIVMGVQLPGCNT